MVRADHNEPADLQAPGRGYQSQQVERWAPQQIAHLLGGSKHTGPSRASPNRPHTVSETSPRNQFRADDNLRVEYVWGRIRPGGCPISTPSVRAEGGLGLSSLAGSLLWKRLDDEALVLQQVLPGSRSHPQHWEGAIRMVLAPPQAQSESRPGGRRNSYVFAACSNSESRLPDPQLILQPVGGPASQTGLLSGLQSPVTCGW